jgi:hypothetical protein
MWGYNYTTTAGETVYVLFGDNGTGDVQSFTLEDYIKWYNASTTI